MSNTAAHTGSSLGRAGKDHIGAAPEGTSFIIKADVVVLPKNLSTIRSNGVAIEEPFDLMGLVQPTHDYTVVVYSAILVFGLLANCYMFVRCFRRAGKNRHGKTHVHLIHIVTANLFICCFAIPIEIGWRSTIEWRGGDFGCRVLQFFRVFGLYALAHNMTAIAFDKLMEVRQLLRGGYGRGMPSTRFLFITSWSLSALCSFPQVLIFQAGYSEYSTTVIQCIGIESFGSMDHERIYNIFMLLLMFVLPSALMFTCYLYIYRIITIVQDLPDDLEHYALTTSLPENSSSGFEPQPRTRLFTNSGLEPQMRTRVFSMGQASRSSIQTWSNKYHSQNGNVSTASADSIDHEMSVTSPHIHLRSSEGIYVMLDDTFERDLRIFSTIALTYVIMCLPYISFTLWYLIDSLSHGQIHPIIQELPYVLVTANTLFIPAVYTLKLCVTD